MPASYKMVVFNCIALFTLLLGLGFYRYVFPKKTPSPFWVLLLFSALPVISIFRPGVYESGDFNIHIYRTISFYQSLSEGNMLPSWAEELNATYGYPLFIFNYTFPYYIISFFHFIGFTFITSMKLFLAINFILSGIFMYLCAKRLFQNSIAAFTTTIFYQFVPYHLIDLHYKVAIGEVSFFTLLPLVFFFLLQLYGKRSVLLLFLTGLLLGFLIMSHIVLALFSMGVFFMYALFLSLRFKKMQYVSSTFITFFFGAVGSTYLWATPFFMSQYTILKKMSEFGFSQQFLELFYSPWKMGLLFQGPRGEISLLIGYAQIIVVVIITILMIRRKIKKKLRAYVLFWLATFFFMLFLMTPYSEFLWKSVPFLKSTGGSHRLLLLTAFTTSLLAGYLSLVMVKKRFLLSLLIGFAVFSTILNWGHRTVIPTISDQTLIDLLPSSTSQGEAHWYANSQYRTLENPWFSEVPKNHLEIIKGNGEIKEISRKTTIHKYVVNATTPLILKENTLFFPGWKILSNGKPILISHDKEGVISFTLQKGLQYTEVVYEDIFIYKVLKIISMIGFLCLVGCLGISLLLQTTIMKRLFKKT